MNIDTAFTNTKPKRKVGRPKKVPLKRKNVLIRDLTKDTNDLIDQACNLTNEKTAAKAIMKGLQMLVDLNDQHVTQGEKLADLQDAVDEMLQASDAVQEHKKELNNVEATRIEKGGLLKTLFQEKHQGDVQQRQRWQPYDRARNYDYQE